jgi:hypothetical protein
VSKFNDTLGFALIFPLVKKTAPAMPVVLKEMVACLKQHLGAVGKNAIVPPRAGGKRILID